MDQDMKIAVIESVLQDALDPATMTAWYETACVVAYVVKWTTH